MILAKNYKKPKGLSLPRNPTPPREEYETNYDRRSSPYPKPDEMQYDPPDYGSLWDQIMPPGSTYWNPFAKPNRLPVLDLRMNPSKIRY